MHVLISVRFMIKEYLIQPAHTGGIAGLWYYWLQDIEVKSIRRTSTDIGTELNSNRIQCQARQGHDAPLAAPAQRSAHTHTHTHAVTLEHPLVPGWCPRP